MAAAFNARALLALYGRLLVAAGATGRAARVGFDGDGFAFAMEGGYCLLR